MSSEQATYEKDWNECRDCKTRRPLWELTGLDQPAPSEDRICRDRAWCGAQQARRAKAAEQLPPLPRTDAAHAGELVADLEAARGEG